MALTWLKERLFFAPPHVHAIVAEVTCSYRTSLQGGATFVRFTHHANLRNPQKSLLHAYSGEDWSRPQTAFAIQDFARQKMGCKKRQKSEGLPIGKYVEIRLGAGTLGTLLYSPIQYGVNTALMSDLCASTEMNSDCLPPALLASLVDSSSVRSRIGMPMQGSWQRCRRHSLGK